MDYTLYYRNYLKSCNYKCKYCPFPKVIPEKKKIERDKSYLEKFIRFIKNSDNEFNVFFAPKGEALIQDYYRKGVTNLSWFKNIREVVIQTNLSCDLDWVKDVNRDKLILWTTYHPKEVDIMSFWGQVKILLAYNIRFTIGIVGVKENFIKIKEMNNLLRQLKEDSPYLWINAFKNSRNYYGSDDTKLLKEYDPLFEINLKDYSSKGLECRTGENVFFVEWNGNIHRCWQDRSKIGNIYTDNLDLISTKSNCKKDVCGCFIGYSNIKSLNLDKIYKNSLLGRIT